MGTWQHGLLIIHRLKLNSQSTMEFLGITSYNLLFALQILTSRHLCITNKWKNSLGFSMDLGDIFTSFLIKLPGKYCKRPGLNFLKWMSGGASLLVNLTSLLATTFDSNHWVSTIKHQLTQALVEYIVNTLQKKSVNCNPYLSVVPSPIQPINLYKSDILMLRLMETSDNSTEGVRQPTEKTCW